MRASFTTVVPDSGANDGSKQPRRRSPMYLRAENRRESFNPALQPMHELYGDQFLAVQEELMSQGTFSKAAIEKVTTDFYKNMGINEFYFATSSVKQIGMHLNSIIAANVLHQASRADFFPLIHQRGNDQSVVISRASLSNRWAAQNYVVEKMLEREYLNFGGPDIAWRLQGFRSVGSVFDDLDRSDERLRTCFLEKPLYPNGETAANETRLELLVDQELWKYKQNTATARIYARLNESVVFDPTELHLAVHMEPRGDAVYRVDFAFRRSPGQESFYSNLGDIVTMFGMFSRQKHVEPLANGVVILTCFLELTKEVIPGLENLAFKARLDQMVAAARIRFMLPSSPYNQLCLSRELDVFEAAYCHAVTKFAHTFARSVGPSFGRIARVLEHSAEVDRQDLHQVRTRLKCSTLQEEHIYSVVQHHPMWTKRFFQEFRRHHDVKLVPKASKDERENIYRPADTNEPNNLRSKSTKQQHDDPETSDSALLEGVPATAPFEADEALRQACKSTDDLKAAEVFSWFGKFNECVLKTNFFKPDVLGLAFRCDPAFFLSESDYEDRPHGIFFFTGNGYKGFHCRFAEVARGGVRVVLSSNLQQYHRNSQEAFDEVYKLARTQHFKNKDIPEGGSKAVLILDPLPDQSLSGGACDNSSGNDSNGDSSNKNSNYSPHSQRSVRNCFVRLVDTLLDLLLLREQHSECVVVDRLNQADEVIFLGPDEHTGSGGLMDWAAQHAKRRGAWFWRAFTTGKAAAMGGIPHDRFGMTTISVEAYVRGTLDKLGLQEDCITKSQTGGPDGDLGSNSIKMSGTRLISLVDGAGVLCDPMGLDRGELLRLVKLRDDGLPTSSTHFNPKLLSPRGFKVSVADNDVVLPDGTRVASGMTFRNEFHLHELSSADLFNPNGGRPGSITLENVNRLFHEADGKPRFKIIVEGANLFITEDARLELERRGVILFKDASTNKGGVTSSSLEVLAAMALDDETFERVMAAKDPENPPPFYMQYVAGVKTRILENAKLEFEELWVSRERSGSPSSTLTNVLSSKIIELKHKLLSSAALWRNETLRRAVLERAIPDVLMPGIISYDALLSRVPESYLKAIFASYVASRFYYTYGMEASLFELLEFVQQIIGTQNNMDAASRLLSGTN